MLINRFGRGVQNGAGRFAPPPARARPRGCPAPRLAPHLRGLFRRCLLRILAAFFLHPCRLHPCGAFRGQQIQKRGEALEMHGLGHPAADLRAVLPPQKGKRLGALGFGEAIAKAEGKRAPFHIVNEHHRAPLLHAPSHQHPARQRRQIEAFAEGMAGGDGDEGNGLARGLPLADHCREAPFALRAQHIAQIIDRPPARKGGRNIRIFRCRRAGDRQEQRQHRKNGQKAKKGFHAQPFSRASTASPEIPSARGVNRPFSLLRNAACTVSP